MEAIIRLVKSKQCPKGPRPSLLPATLPQPTMAGGSLKRTVWRPSFFVSTVVSPFLRFLLSFPQAWENMFLSAEKTGEI